ncbi:MAG: hypothetical protein K8I82_14720 [Anaerolineae bacterium]|jgi:hypothetical protein|nr:hypothetical protein [Anaerolineae bacterium]
MIKRFFSQDTPFSIGLGVFTVAFLVAGVVTAWVLLIYNGISGLNHTLSLSWDGIWGLLIPVLVFSAILTTLLTLFSMYEYRIYRKNHP